MRKRMAFWISILLILVITLPFAAQAEYGSAPDGTGDNVEASISELEYVPGEVIVMFAQDMPISDAREILPAYEIPVPLDENSGAMSKSSRMTTVEENRVYLVEYESEYGESAEQVAEELSQRPEIELAIPNYIFDVTDSLESGTETINSTE